jgi:hypothetical protein
MQKEEKTKALEAIGFKKVKGREEWAFDCNYKMSLTAAELAEITSEKQLKQVFGRMCSEIVNAIHMSFIVANKQLEGILPTNIITGGK